jgi:hypothetical protein
VVVGAVPIVVVVSGVVVVVGRVREQAVGQLSNVERRQYQLPRAGARSRARLFRR